MLLLDLNNNNLLFIFSGLLSGKFAKGEIPDSDKSRLGFMNSKNAVGQLGAWATYSEDEKYWNIVQVLKDTARQIGIIFVQTR